MDTIITIITIVGCVGAAFGILWHEIKEHRSDFSAYKDKQADRWEENTRQHGELRQEIDKKVDRG